MDWYWCCCLVVLQFAAVRLLAVSRLSCWYYLVFWFGVLWYICVGLRFLVFDCGYLRLGGLYYGYYLGVVIVVCVGLVNSVVAL